MMMKMELSYILKMHHWKVRRYNFALNSIIVLLVITLLTAELLVVD